MNKFSKVALATLLAVTSITAVGCSSSTEETKPAATEPAKKDDTALVNRAVLAAVLVAEEKLVAQFNVKSTALEGDKEVSYMSPAKSKDDSVAFLSAYWSKEVAEKEYAAVLGDAAYLEKANKEIEAKVNKDNAAQTDEKKKVAFEALTAVADSTKLGSNTATGAKFEDAKFEGKDNKYTMEYKGLKYTVEKNGSSYKIVGKEGTLAK